MMPSMTDVQPSFVSPLTYQFDPLSARIIPYFLSAAMIAAPSGDAPVTFTLALSRTRSPIGGRDVSLFPAACVAGLMYACCDLLIVKRKACVMFPLFTSSKRTNPGRTGSPAASALVHPTVRSAFEFKCQTAPFAAFQS